VSRIAFPPALPWPELDDLRSTRDRVEGEQRETAATLRRLDGERREAVTADRRALGAAIVNGRKEPEDTAVAKCDAQILAARRRAEALEQALIEVDGKLTTLVEERREAWLAEQDETVSVRREELRAALATYLAARHQLAQAYAVRRWIATFPSKSYSPTDPPLLALKSPAGEPYYWAAIAAALEADVDPPAPKPQNVTNLPLSVPRHEVGRVSGSVDLRI